MIKKARSFLNEARASLPFFSRIVGRGTIPTGLSCQLWISTTMYFYFNILHRLILCIARAKEPGRKK